MSWRERFPWIAELPYLTFAFAGVGFAAFTLSTGAVFVPLTYGVGGSVLSAVLILDRRRRQKRRRLPSVGGFMPMALPSAEDASALEDVSLTEVRCHRCGAVFKADPELDVVYCVKCTYAHRRVRRPSMLAPR